tara:strand:- start:95 stop:742 length:648 start_codon:yes stop_codon:yes gene_type:complete
MKPLKIDDFSKIDFRIESSLPQYKSNNDDDINRIIIELKIKIKDNKNNLGLFYLRGFNYLMKGEFKNAINDFSNLIYKQKRKNHIIYPGIRNKNISYRYYAYLDQITIFRSNFLLIIAQILDGQTINLISNYQALHMEGLNLTVFRQRPYFMIYPNFILLTAALYIKDFDKALKIYSKIKNLDLEFFNYEKDLFNLLPNKNDRYFYSLINLISLS